ncbi:MAG TPA: pyridoxal-dependent decarboxylase, partial [Longimicrobiales bacterium]
RDVINRRASPNGNAVAAMGAEYPEVEETLDPGDWEEFRTLAHEMVDRLLDFQRDVHDTPAWRPMPEAVEHRFQEPLPARGAGARGAWNDFLEIVLPYPTGLHHPRWWGWAGGTGSPMGMMAALLGTGSNSVPGNFNDAASRVEAQLLDWMKAAMGFPADASGIVTGGGSEANIVGLTVARDARADGDVPRGGVGAASGRLVFYASAEVHSSLFKAAKILGLGLDAARLIPVDEAFRIRVPELLESISRDRRAGLHPFAVVGTAGTINTGAVDDLNALADVAADEDLWFHVDGAFGAMAALSPETRGLVEGMSRADSLAFDFHKWMYVNYEAGCVLVRDADAHRRSFSAGANYLDPLPRGTGARVDMAGGRGLQLSRGFKALKPWMTLKQHGVDTFGRLVAKNVRQARYLAGLVDASPRLTRAAPVELNVVTFRFDDPEVAPEVRDEVNRELLMRIQERGIAIPSSTLVEGRFTLRACICNHRSRKADFDDLIRRAEEIVEEILSERRSTPTA